MILEQEINRSISNNPYELKIVRYPESNFSIVKSACSIYELGFGEMFSPKEKETQNT